MKLTFGRKLVLAIVVVLAIAQIASGLSVQIATNSHALGRVKEELRVAALVTTDLLAGRAKEFESRVAVIAEDFGFRQAMASRDRQTIESALINHGDRIGAGLILYADVDGRLVASSHHGLGSKPRYFPLPDLLQTGRPAGQRSTLFEIEKELYILSVVPVFAPTLIGWLGMGIPLQSELVDEVAGITGQQLLFWSRARQAPLRSTLADDAASQLVASLQKPGFDEQNLTSTQLSGRQYLYRPLELSTLGNGGIGAIALASVSAAQEQFSPLKMQLVLISVVALLLSVLFALALGRTFTRPITMLVAAARRIQAGSYDRKLDAPSDDELGGLANALNQMQEAISVREHQISHQARHDSLTGLANRAVAHDRLDTAIQRAQRRKLAVAVVTLDLNRFKEINDSLGHHVGDLALKEVATRLQRSVRASDTVCRLGGDEFLVLLEEGSMETLREVVHQVVENLNGDGEIDAYRLRISASTGVAFYPEHGTAVEELLRRSDIAMFQAKSQARPLVEYEAGLDEGHLRQMRLMNELPAALESGQFSLCYQPKADAQTLVVNAAEALIRWRHPEFGMVSPEEFITLAEHSGSIRKLTRWVIKRVMQQQAKWRSSGRLLNISVNLSAIDLMDLDFPDLLLSYGRLHQVPADCLTLEITEGTIMTDAAIAESVLNRLKSEGYSISIDDFGTGYSSLAQLKRMPVGELKIDKSFVLNMESNADDEIIVRSTVTMARNMGIKVVVEGVETAAALDMLRRWGVDVIQGYFLGKPMDTEQFESWLDARERPVAVNE